MSNISFANPWLLFVALPLVAVVTVPFAITVRKDNANAHNITSFVLHLVICACITLALAGMTFERVITETNVYVLADISYSADDNLDEVQQNLQKISQKLPKNSKMGVICFGRNYQLLSTLGEPVPDVRTADDVDRSATDIASALRYAGNLFEEGVIKRIIVITDGAETVSTNSIMKVVSSLQDNDVYVDAVYLDDNIKDDVRELQIDGVDASPSTYLDKEEEVSVLVRANCGEVENSRINGYISLYRDGKFLDGSLRTETFYSGLNTVTLTLPTDEAGTFRYEVRISAVNDDDDKSAYNNSYLFSQTVSAERKVLFLGGSSQDCDAGWLIYGDDNVDYISDASKVPFSVEDLCIYDEIVLSNFDVRTVESPSAFTASLTTLVSDYGKTLMTYGNTFVQEESWENGTTPLTQLSDLLPVKIGNSETDTRLIAIVIDISRSMNYVSRFAVAKRAAVELLKVLNSTDYVMVIGFSGGVTELLPPTPLTVPSIIIDRINECEAENGTYLSEALFYTDRLMPTRFHDKQVIIISDGLNPDSDNGPAITKAHEMSEKNIAVSAIGIYPDDVGEETLKSIVYNRYQTNRAFYKAITHESEIDMVLDSIASETSQIKIEGDSYEVKIKSKEKVTENVNSLNPVKGFWYNSAKSTATTVLTATYFRDRITSFDVPLYAYWQSGKGKVVSFTSDIASSWTMSASGFFMGDGMTFYGNIAAATLPDERVVTPFIASVESDGGTATIYVSASSTLKDTTDFSAVITDPEGNVYMRNLSYSSSVYASNFQVDHPGIYKIHLEYRSGDISYVTDTEFSVPYYAEYDAFATFSKAYMYRLLTDYGEILELDEISALENSHSAYTTFIYDFTMLLMIICAVLFVMEIIIRQLKWKDVTSFFRGIFRRRA